MIILEIVTGLGVGIIFGLLGWLFKFIKHLKYTIWFKAVYCLSMAIGVVLASDLTGFKGAKYIASLTFGYVSY